MDNVQEIKELSRSELARFINNNRGKNNNVYFCERCGNTLHTTNRRNLYWKNSQEINGKKICSLCTDCYSDLLDFLEIGEQII